jgi:hypothetical protein
MYDKPCGLVGDGIQHLLQPSILLVAAEIGENPGFDIHSGVVWPANANAHAPVIYTKMPVNVAQAIVATMATAYLHPEAAGGKVQLVMENENIVQVNFVKAGNFGHRQARSVHETLRFCQNDLFGADPALTDQRGPPGFPAGKTMRRGKPINRHKTDIVPVHGIG